MKPILFQEDGFALKAKRDQYAVEIRKKKNEGEIRMKRMKLAAGLNEQQGSGAAIPQRSHLENMKHFNDLATEFFTHLKSNAFEDLITVTENIRKSISLHDDPPIDELISTGLIPHIIRLLSYEYFHYERLMNECAWIMANVASSAKSGHIEYLVQNEVAQNALNLLDHDSEEVKDNAIWILSNIAGDSIQNRDMLIEMRIVDKVANMLDGHAYQPSFLGHVAWLISNLCRGKPYPKFSKVEALLPILGFFVHRVDNEEVIHHTLWALSYLSDGDEKQIKAILDMEVAHYVLAMMRREEVNLRAPAIRAAGNLLTEIDDLTGIMIAAGAIPVLAELLSDPRKVFRKEVCWAFSNILAGSQSHIEEVMTYADGAIIRKFFEMIFHDDMEVAKECLYCLTNICAEGGLTHIQKLVENNFMELLVDNLNSNNDANVLKVILEAIGSILDAGKQVRGENPYLLRLGEIGGLVAIENLQNHLDNDVYKIVSDLIEKHLEYEKTI